MHADYEIHLSLLAIASSNQTTTQISRISSTIINTMSTETSYESANFDPTIFSGLIYNFIRAHTDSLLVYMCISNIGTWS